MKNKLFTLAFFLMVSINFLIASTTSVDGIWYNFNSSTNTAQVTYQGTTYSNVSNEYSGSVVIPSTVEYNSVIYTVTSIGDNAFRGCSNLTAVSIPESVTSIGTNAFWNTQVSSIYISNLEAWCNMSFAAGGGAAPTFTNFNYYLYLNHSLITNLVIPNGITKIKDYAFCYCSSITSVTIPNGVTSIGNQAFLQCGNLQNITIPNSVTSIGGSAFSYCTSLNSIEIPNNVTSIGPSAFNKCSSLGSINIPASVTSIGNGAWSASGIHSVYITDLVAWCNIPFGTFCSYNSYDLYLNGSKVTEMSVPNGVTTINNYAFAFCTSIISVILPSSVTSIGVQAFCNCSSLIDVKIPNSVVSIGADAFTGARNISYDGNATGSPWGASHVNAYADGVLVFNDSTKTNLLACSTNATGDIIIPNSVTNIGNGAFKNCNRIKSIYIGNNVTEIGANAFNACSSLKTITIPNSVISIGNSAFYDCSGITSITIPGSVTSIGDKAFYNCLEITCLGENPATLGEETFKYRKVYYSGPDGNYTKTTHIYVPCGTIEDYKTKWTSYDSLIIYKELPYLITGDVNNEKMGSVIVPQNVCEQLIATPNYGHHFVQWSDGVTEMSRMIELTHDTSLIAKFAKNHMISYEYDNIMGNVIGDSITPTGVAADSITFEAIPNYGYHFVQWNDSVTDNPRSIYIDKDTSFTAKFAKNVYTITYIADSIMGNIQGLQQAEYLDSVTFDANSNYGYHFVHWSDGVTTNPRTIELTRDTIFTAVFVKNTYTITKQVSPQGWGKVAGKNSSLYLDSVTITANPNYGYHFVQWNDSITDNPRKFVLEQDTMFTAVFARNTYTVTTETSNVEWGSTTGDTSTLYLDTITLTATPNYGYHFVRWSDGNTTNPHEVVVRKDDTYRAIFEKNVYSVNKLVDATYGTITGVSQANYLDSVSLFVTPNYGYHFVQWSDSVTDNPRTFILTQDTTFTAEFGFNKYLLSLTCDSVTGVIDGENGSFNYLSEHSYTAIPNYGYHFVRWSDGVAINPRTIIVERDSVIEAIFANNTYSITYNADVIKGSIQGVSSAEYLQEVSFTAIANHGYHFVQWSDSVTDNQRSFVLTQDTTFTAEFAQTFSGQCGDSLYWAFANDTLAFSGSGKMYHYATDSLPWILLTQEVQYIEFAPEMTSVSEYAFQNMKNLRKVNLPSKIITIGENAFANCTSINNLTIPNSVASLGEGAFYDCSNIDTLIIGTGVTAITNQFRGCTSLRYLQLGQNIESIDYGSFYDARQLIFIVCHPTLPPLAYPDEVGKERSFYNMNAQVLIPCDNFDAYNYDAMWGSFNLKCQSSNSGVAIEGQVTVIPGDADATFTWPTATSAETYNLEITKDSAVFCNLIFNSEGQLLGIAFAPSRNGTQRHIPAATMTTKGMSFKVTGLDYASQYRFSFETKNVSTQTVFAYTGAFHTNGTDGPQGFEDVDAETPAQKIFRDGQIFILRDDRVYTLTGQEVR